MEEIWKPFKPYLVAWTNQYKIYVSNLGNIQNRAGAQVTYPYIWVNNSWYNYFQFKIEGKRRSFLVHRIVKIVFHGLDKTKKCINHLDHNKHNNKLENLEWVTHKENINYDWLKGKRKTITWESHHFYNKTGALHPKSKPIIQLDGDNKVIKEWGSANLAAIALNWNRTHISQSIKRGSKAYWYFWKFKI